MSKGQTRERFLEAERKYFGVFVPKIQAVTTKAEALALATSPSMPGESKPGRRFHTGLRAYLESGTVPEELDEDTREAFLTMERRLGLGT